MKIIKDKAALLEIINNVPHYIFWKDTDLVFRGCNKIFARQFGYENPIEIIGKTDEEFPWSDELREKYRKDDLAVINTGKPKLNYEELQEQPDGSVKTVLVSKVPYCDKKGKIIGVLGIYTDITERKKQEKELKRAKEEAEKSNQMKSNFISNMEHDIRTPFVGIYGIIDLLAKQETDPEKKSLLYDVAICAKELMDYCDGILDFSKIESQSFPVVSKAFDLRKLVDSAMIIEDIAAKHKKLNFSLNYDSKLPPIIMGDPYRLKRILINLISNAIKFTKEGYVSLSVSLSNRLPDTRSLIVNFMVKDSGIGIPKESRQFIYERFTKVIPSNKGLYKGQGLGLRIVKQFLDELGGEIHLKSEVGKGSTFVVFLPFKIPLSNEIIDDEE